MPHRRLRSCLGGLSRGKRTVFPGSCALAWFKLPSELSPGSPLSRNVVLRQQGSLDPTIKTKANTTQAKPATANSASPWTCTPSASSTPPNSVQICEPTLLDIRNRHLARDRWPGFSICDPVGDGSCQKTRFRTGESTPGTLNDAAHRTPFPRCTVEPPLVPQDPHRDPSKSHILPL